MVVRATAANPAIIQWARESIGLSIEEFAAQVGKSPETIEAWETGLQFPTYRQLETLAQKLGRPLALFFFPEPPKEEPLRSTLRTLPPPEFERLEASTLLTIRSAKARQLSLWELTGGKNPAEFVITRLVRARVGSDVVKLARQVREHLGVPLARQFQWNDATEAFHQWRPALAEAGVFVFRGPIQQRDVSGFCLFDEEFPIIVVNSSTPWSRQVFTLFHELGHLLYRVSGITSESVGQANQYTERERKIEIACNQFAAEFLVPADSFPWAMFTNRRDIRQLAVDVSHLAKRYSVSREVILRRLRDRDQVSQDDYEKLAQRWNQEFNDQKGGSGGSYYANEVSYLGNEYIELAFSRYHSGTITLEELSDHLGVKAKNVDKFEDYFQERPR